MNASTYLLERSQNKDLAVISGTTDCTYGDLKTAVGLIQKELMEKAIQPGQRVGLLGENSVFWIAAYLAILRIGAVVVPLPIMWPEEELRRLTEFVHLQAVCVEGCRLERQQNWLARTNLPVISGKAILTKNTLNNRLLDGLNSQPVEPDQEAALMLTSGTTSAPKVVRISHRNIQANSESIIEYLELTADDRIMVVLPFFYCFGTSLLHTHLRVGGTLVLNNRFAYPETVLDLMQSSKCTGLAGVPTTFQTLLRDSTFSRRRFPELKKVQQAGGKLSPVLIEELCRTLPDAKIFIMYGQTEATARLSYLPPSYLDKKIGSIGRGIPGVDLRVIGEDGEPVQPGQVGEIIARGENIALGYLDNPQATDEKFGNGELHTGDLATVDKEGFIYIVDRKSDFLKPYGHRVSSQLIEAYLLGLPEVVSAAVIGVPDLACGEAVEAYLVLAKGSRLSEADILSYCRRCMPRYMIPQGVQIMETLPMSENGKVVKTSLRQQAMVFKPCLV